MYKKSLLVMSLLIFFAPKVFSAKQLGAHVHGSIGLDIATDKKQLLVMLRGPSESFLGFEYAPKTKAEKFLFADVKKSLTEGLTSLLGSDSLSDCTVAKQDFEQRFKSKTHSEIRVESYFACEEVVKGRKLSIRLKEKFSNIDIIHLQLIREDGSVISNKNKNNVFSIQL